MHNHGFYVLHVVLNLRWDRGQFLNRIPFIATRPLEQHNSASVSASSAIFQFPATAALCTRSRRACITMEMRTDTANTGFHPDPLHFFTIPPRWPNNFRPWGFWANLTVMTTSLRFHIPGPPATISGKANIGRCGRVSASVCGHGRARKFQLRWPNEIKLRSVLSTLEIESKHSGSGRREIWCCYNSHWKITQLRTPNIYSLLQINLCSSIVFWHSRSRFELMNTTAS